jgi:predicted MPP superfamily phosphohydrolase
MNIEDNPDYSPVINLCARLNAIAPVYYALGNHEIDAILFNDSQIYYDLKAAGINVLNNEVKTAEIGLSQIDVIGLTQNPKEFYEYGKKFFDEAMSDDDNFKLVLNHYPENFEGTLDDYNIDLAICGNAHGGQVRLPLIGGLYSADQGLFPQLCDGYHEIGNSKVIITKGLGTSGIVPRINNAPEITIVDINWY